MSEEIQVEKQTDIPDVEAAARATPADVRRKVTLVPAAQQVHMPFLRAVDRDVAQTDGADARALRRRPQDVQDVSLARQQRMQGFQLRVAVEAGQMARRRVGAGVAQELDVLQHPLPGLGDFRRGIQALQACVAIPHELAGLFGKATAWMHVGYFSGGGDVRACGGRGAGSPGRPSYASAVQLHGLSFLL